jgi:hypothetical protein
MVIVVHRLSQHFPGFCINTQLFGQFSSHAVSKALSFFNLPSWELPVACEFLRGAASGKKYVVTLYISSNRLMIWIFRPVS